MMQDVPTSLQPYLWLRWGRVQGARCFGLVILARGADPLAVWLPMMWALPRSLRREGYSMDRERTLAFFLKPEVTEGTPAGQALRDSWRQALPNARPLPQSLRDRLIRITSASGQGYYGTTDDVVYTVGDLARNGNAIFPGDLQYEVFKNRAGGVDPDDTNPNAMPTQAASCFPGDVYSADTSGDTGGGTGATTTGGGTGGGSTTTSAADAGTGSGGEFRKPGPSSGGRFGLHVMGPRL